MRAGPTISVLICTMDRPELLARCLSSIMKSSLLPTEIVVSDDSREPQLTQTVCSKYALVRYLRGPQKGIGANRQFGAEACRGDYISFVDDDIIMSECFLRRAAKYAMSGGAKSIYTGPLQDQGLLKIPANLTFWGHFGADPANGLQTVNICVNLFPRRVLEVSRFDSRLRCYEDSDFCAQAVAAGYQIYCKRDLVNTHLPLVAEMPTYSRYLEMCRFYTSLKRYFIFQRKPVLALAYFILAPLHQVLSHIKKRRWRRVPLVFCDFGIAVGWLFSELSQRHRVAPVAAD